jgi:DNA-binding MarR family transcriptional regulator
VGQPNDVQDARAALHDFGLARDRLNIGFARALRLSAIDLYALEHLEAAGPLTPGALQQALGLTSGAVTALLDRLEERDLVSRSPHPDDRRSLLVELSPAAQADGEAELGDFHREIARAVKRLSPDDRAVVTRFLRSAAKAASKAGDRFWDTPGRRLT